MFFIQNSSFPYKLEFISFFFFIIGQGGGWGLCSHQPLVDRSYNLIWRQQEGVTCSTHKFLIFSISTLGPLHCWARARLAFHSTHHLVLWPPLNSTYSPGPSIFHYNRIVPLILSLHEDYQGFIYKLLFDVILIIARK